LSSKPDTDAAFCSAKRFIARLGEFDGAQGDHAIIFCTETFSPSGNLIMTDTSRCLVSILAAAAMAVALAGCQRAAEEKKVAPPAAWTLDESKLQQPTSTANGSPPMRFPRMNRAGVQPGF
jgi:hypothetical protein